MKIKTYNVVTMNINRQADIFNYIRLLVTFHEGIMRQVLSDMHVTVGENGKKRRRNKVKWWHKFRKLCWKSSPCKSPIIQEK